MTKTSHFCLTESFLIMKYLYTLFTLLALSFGFSQETLEDFEGASAATAEFGGATALIVDDPEWVELTEKLRRETLQQVVRFGRVIPLI